MASPHSLDVALRAEQFYETNLRRELEAKHRDSFVAIEPESGDYFLGDSLSAAIQSARAAYPNRISFAIRIGHPTAVTLGAVSP
jgi:hypothetical protein